MVDDGVTPVQDVCAGGLIKSVATTKAALATQAVRVAEIVRIPCWMNRALVGQPASINRMTTSLKRAAQRAAAQSVHLDRVVADGDAAGVEQRVMVRAGKQHVLLDVRAIAEAACGARRVHLLASPRSSAW